MRLVQCSWEGEWEKNEPERMILADSVAEARQVQTPIFSKLGIRTSALCSPAQQSQHPQGAAKQGAQSDLAQPITVPCTGHIEPLGTCTLYNDLGCMCTGGMDAGCAHRTHHHLAAAQCASAQCARVPVCTTPSSLMI